jgi:hypothetical protein
MGVIRSTLSGDSVGCPACMAVESAAGAEPFPCTSTFTTSNNQAANMSCICPCTTMRSAMWEAC